jgi:hypothetical protein
MAIASPRRRSGNTHAGPGRAARYGELADIAWYRHNALDVVHEVGRKAPNAWGFHDMGDPSGYLIEVGQGTGLVEGRLVEQPPAARGTERADGR